MRYRFAILFILLLILPELVGNFSLSILLSYIITLGLILLPPHKFFRLPGYVFLIVTSCSQLGYILYSGKRIDSYFWLALLSANSNESLSFFDGLGPSSFMVLLSYALALIALAVVHEKKFPVDAWLKRFSQVGVKLLLVILVFGVEYASTKTWRLNTSRNVYPFVIVDQYQQSIFYLDRIFLPTASAEIRHEPFFDRIVLVIGESLSKTRMSLYGYSKKTTPKLDSRNDIIVYQDMFAPGLNTQPNLKTFFSGKLSDGIDGISMDIFRLAKLAGYYVTYIDNNKYKNRDPIYMIGSQADEFISLNGIGETNKITDQTIKWDGELTSHYLDNLAKNRKKHLIILHMAGSHSNQSQRYPPEYEKIQSHYDNSVYYTDYLVNEWISELAKTSRQEKSLFVFVSDHGVKLPPGCGLGEVPVPDWNSYGSDDRYYSNLAIPLVFWVSDQSKRELKKEVKNLLKNSKEPLDHRFFLPTLATAFGIENIEGFEIKSKSLFLSDPLVYKPRMNHGGLDMDEALKSGQICRE
jgi:heptose-I-phosphate ethanolaminephosphotransferase